MTKKKTTPREKQARPTSCVGCGEAAAGYNYDAPSCNSCKTFFRRTVISKKLFKGCLLGGICERDEAARRCRACRYDNCIRGGMNPLMILGYAQGEVDEGRRFSPDVPSTSTASSDSSPHQMSIGVVACKEVDNGLRRLERALRDSRNYNSSHDSPSGSLTRSDSTSSQEMRLLYNPTRVENQVDKMILHLIAIEEAHQRLRTSNYTPTLSPELTMDNFVHGPSKLSENFPTMCVMPAQKVPYPLFPVEIIIKYRQYMDFSKFDYSKSKLWFVQDVVYSVEFMKALPIYHQLDDKSKKVLISSALTCSNFTAAYYSYFNGTDRTLFPDGCLMKWDSKLQEQAPNSARCHSAIIAAMRQADLDAREYALLKMIVVCNPMLEGLTPHGASMLCKEKERCTKALLSYILAKRGVEQGPAFFMKMVAVINVLIELTSWEKNQHVLATALGLYNTPTPFGEAIFHSV